jgi:hypothetical protein
MACAGCGQTRQQFFTAVRHFNPRGAYQAVRQGVAINMDKLAGMSSVDVAKKYGSGNGSTAKVVKASPYKRTT